MDANIAYQHRHVQEHFLNTRPSLTLQPEIRDPTKELTKNAVVFESIYLCYQIMKVQLGYNDQVKKGTCASVICLRGEPPPMEA